MFIFKYCLLLLVFEWSWVSAEIFKCTTPSGQIKYQSKECHDNDQSKVLNIKNYPRHTQHDTTRLNNISNQESEVDHKKNQDSQTVKYLKKQKAQRCRVLKKRYKTAQRKVKERCKKRRDVFCDLPASQIEKNERIKAISQISRSRGGGVVTIPAYSEVEMLKKEYENFGCR